VETPHSLRTKVNVAIGSGALVLVSGKVEVLRASMEQLSATARLYPVTVALAATISSVSVTTPEGSFLRAGIREAGASQSSSSRNIGPQGASYRVQTLTQDIDL